MYMYFVVKVVFLHVSALSLLQLYQYYCTFPPSFPQYSTCFPY